MIAIGRVAGGVALVGAGQEQAHRARLGIAHGDQVLVGQDEGDRGALRLGAVDGVEDVGGHVVGAALEVEPARHLDLGHLLARRDLDADEPLDLLLLVPARD